MQALNTFHWAQDKIDEITAPAGGKPLSAKQHREAQACERRLRQMADRREKQIQREGKAEVERIARLMQGAK